ncbi:hypothetical protein [Dactylosporangium sp. NPDC049140]|uniref:hypothetical protein n=1 Tax=Dactylosporangium sp. NPDC049140 TaxID=3155647 RepID=UPI0033F9D83A
MTGGTPRSLARKAFVADTWTGARLRPTNGLGYRRIAKVSEVVGGVVAFIRDEDRSTIAL